MLQPNSQGHGSYFEAFKRRSNVSLDAAQRDKVLTDRGAYLNFLEIQLERVSAACITSQHFGSRIDAATAKATAAEEKVMSATKLVRLAQTYSEEQGREQGRINDAMEIRLESLEQQIDAVSTAVDHAATAQSNSEVCSCEGDGGIPSTRHPPVHPPGLHEINTAGLSEWMTGVDKQLEDLRNLVSAQLTTGSGSSNSSGGGGDGGLKATSAAGGSPQAEDDAEEAAVQETKTAAVATARDECARIEERVRRLEEAIEETGPGAGHSGGDASLPSPATTVVVDQRDRGRRLERCAELAQEGLTRSRSASRSPVRRNPSAPSPAIEAAVAPLANDAGTLTVEVDNDALLGAAEDGTAVARRASEVAEEALKAGREAIERSERTESLAKTIAVRSFKLAKERHEEVTTVLDRLGEDIRSKGDRVRCRPRSAGECRGDGVDSARPAGTSETMLPAGAARGRRGRCRRAVSAAPQERRRPAKARRGDARGFGRQALHDTEEAAEQLAAAQEPGGGDTGTHRSVREIREILENSSFADSDNGRRIALGAARTALESILREASPGLPPDRGTERQRLRAAQGRQGPVLAGDGGNEVRRADELREAIRGAVTILSGIGGGGPNVQGEEDTRQRHPSRCSRLGRRPGSRLSKSRDRPATPPPRGCRDGKRHAESYWVPPGSIPCKVGERRGGGGLTHHARVPLEVSGDEGGEEIGAVAVVS
ncbi:unnamed protein product [Ectocarpus fasciculatus]